ncbi:MAG: hypothetical protein GXO57_02360 [Thermodesulfobacteria bacterium]|nr:hypothetical protein [Thermodesulfobacteriota bacterium]
MFAAFDCEGPITLNDNAFEYCAYRIPKGDEFFKKISRFDDYLADIKKLPGYKAGDTLKLILPFLKLFGASNQELEEFSKKTLLFLPRADEVLVELNRKFPVFIISTSYEPYLKALCEKTGFPFSQVFCTKLDLDSVPLSKGEAKRLKELFKEILELPEVDFPSSAKTPEELSPQTLEVFERLERLFFEEVAQMEVGRFLREVNPIGGREKAEACKQISERLSVPLSEGVYTGDSITDTEALKLLKESQGLAIAFNANRYALRAAEFYALSKSAKIFTYLFEELLKKGKKALAFMETEFGEAGRIPEDKEKFEALVKKSEAFRKKVRGEVVGALG